MNCPKCGGRCRTIESQGINGAMRRRRYECRCGNRFATLEAPEKLYAELRAARLDLSASESRKARMAEEDRIIAEYQRVGVKKLVVENLGLGRNRVWRVLKRRGLE